MRKFYNYTADIIRTTPKIEGGSLLDSETVIYSNIWVSIWKNRSSQNNDTNLASATVTNGYQMNLRPEHQDITIGDTVIVTDFGRFNVDDIILHHNHRGILDNIQVFISKITD